jgi:transcriptional regulator with XRE-family HTH domain
MHVHAQALLGLIVAFHEDRSLSNNMEITDGSTAIDLHLAQRVQAGRRALGWTLERLAAESGVSRAMISRIERGESSPTAALLARLAAALGTSLASLFAEPASDGGPLLRAAEQPAWRDPQSGYVRRSVSPAGTGSPVEIVEVEFPPRASVRFEPFTARAFDQHVWILSGRLVLTVGGRRHELADGDCLHLTLDEPVTFHNPGSRPVRYVVVLATALAATAPHRAGGAPWPTSTTSPATASRSASSRRAKRTRSSRASPRSSSTASSAARR